MAFKKVESDADEMNNELAASDNLGSSSDSSDESASDSTSEYEIEDIEAMLEEFDDFRPSILKNYNEQLDLYYKLRITEIDEQLEKVKAETAEEYLEPLKGFQEEFRVRTEVAEVERNLRLRSIENAFEAEEQAALQNFENEKSLLFDKMKEELEEKIRKLEEEKNFMDFDSELSLQAEKEMAAQSTSKGGRTSKKGSKQEGRKKKPVSVNGPYIVYMLKDEEIMEDVAAIKKALAIQRNNEAKSAQDEND